MQLIWCHDQTQGAFSVYEDNDEDGNVTQMKMPPKSIPATGHQNVSLSKVTCGNKRKEKSKQGIH